MVWVKSNPCGFLNAKKMPMKKHEMVYVFYSKLPFYDISSHKNKFLKEESKARESPTLYGNSTIIDHADRSKPYYEPSLPTTVLRQSSEAECYDGNITYNYEDRDGPVYDPPLPNTILEIKSERGKHATQKPTALIEWCLKYYSKEGDTVLDPTMGSGSTGVACKKMNRKFIGIEMDEAIFESAKKRLT
jgi:site-specific DNA-methyltransferase (adenine-specific)